MTKRAPMENLAELLETAEAVGKALWPQFDAMFDELSKENNDTVDLSADGSQG